MGIPKQGEAVGWSGVCTMNALRRSLHFVPGLNERMFSKALSLPADALILDLEDSVVPEAKEAARRQVCDWLREDFGGREKLVRINPLDSPWGMADLQAVAMARPDGIMVPKVIAAEDVQVVDQALVSAELEMAQTPGAIPLLLIGTEAPAAVFNLSSLLRHQRVQGVAWGAEDLAAALGARHKRDDAGDYLEVFQLVRSLCLLAAVAAQVQPIDAPFVDIGDGEALRRECQLTAAMGFTGKLTIHPSQIDVVNEAFTPSADEVDQARELLEAFAQARQEGRLAFTFRGAMVDKPHLRNAQRVVERARLICEKTERQSNN